jgi:hypothetical protein
MLMTSIVVQRTTRDKLKQIGRKDQTYDQLITELMEERKRSITLTGKQEGMFGCGIETPSAKPDYVPKGAIKK